MRYMMSYIRVSTEDQKRNISPATQEAKARKWASEHPGYELVGAYADADSGYKVQNRKGFDQMVAEIKRRGDIYGVLVYTLNRIARNHYEYGLLTEVLNVKVISILDETPDGIQGELMQGINISLAKHDSAWKALVISENMEQKAASGTWPSSAPIGYMNIGDGKREPKRVAPDPVQGPLVRELFERYVGTDMSIRDLVKWAKKRGLRTSRGGPPTRTCIEKILKRTMYYGPFEWKGQRYEGNQEPLISSDLFVRAQEKLHGYPSTTGSRHFPYRGYLVCGYCGLGITAQRKKERYTYYHCTESRGVKCQQPWTREEVMGDRLAVVIDGIYISDEMERKILAELGDYHETYDRERRSRIIQLKAEEQRVSDKRHAAYEDRQDELIDEGLWLATDRKHIDRLQIIRQEIARLESEAIPSEDIARRTLELLKRAPRLYRASNDELRAKLLKSVSQNCAITAESVIPVYRDGFDRIAEAVQSDIWYARQDSNL